MHVGVAELTGDRSPTEEPVLVTAKHFRFGTFEFQTSPARLAEEGVPIKVRPQALQVLELLLSRAGEIVTREEIRHHLWGSEEYLDHERGINSALLHLRKALDDDPQNPTCIETVPRHGYRFIAPSELSETPLVSVRSQVEDECPDRTPWGRIAVLASILAAVVSISVLWGRFSETPPASSLPRLMIQPMQAAIEGDEPHASPVSLTDDLVRILVTDYADRVDLADPGPQDANGGPAPNASPVGADFLVVCSLTYDESSDFGITVRLVRADDRTIVWADTKHLTHDELAGWAALAAGDLLGALAALPAGR